MLSFVVLVTFLGSGFLPSVLGTLDPDGVPYPDDPIVLKHRADQAQLKNYEHKQRNDYWFRQSLSPTARLADKIVAQIKVVEDVTIWNRYANSNSSLFPGEAFALARPTIGTTDLFKVVKKLPKGALLHAHLTAMLPYGIIFQTILNTPGMVMSAATDLSNDANRNSTQINFAHANTTISSVAGSIWTSSYISNTPVLVAPAADAFPGGRVAFLSYLQSKLTLGVSDAEQSELGVDAIWRKFQGIFGTVGTTWSYEPLVRAFLQDLFGALADDGVRWVEIRNGGSNGVVLEGQSVEDPDPDYWYDLFEQEVAKFKATSKGKKFWGTRIIWTVSRGKIRSKIIADMKNALSFKQKYPDLIAGYDLVSQEDLGRPLSDLAPELIWFRQQTESLNLTIPYFFHAGETLGDGNSTDDNLFDAEMFNTRRIGHGFSLFKHPLLIDRYREKEIAVEVCLISNEALRLNDDVLQHPLPALIAHGVPAALSNDDPAIEGQNDAGLSYDFYEAIQGFQNIGLAGLGHMAQNSVRYSNFEDQDDATWLADIEADESGDGIKAQHLQEWKKDWEDFCKWVVKEFGAKYNVTS
ncbi:adenosine deaminase family protein [Acephala macrosclerotiorum]|nr:adenosine deaminase family protein [Acephala macrosclerotiorum]